MKKTMIFLILYFIIFNISAQDIGKDSLSKKELKEKRKKEKEEILKKKFDKICQILYDSSFVCEIKNERFGNDSYVVNPLLNFIMVDSTDLVIQITNNNSSGMNGFGGITSKGTLSKYQLKCNEKRKSCYLAIILSTKQIGYLEVNIDISTDGYAFANCSYGFNGIYKFSFDGQIVGLDESNVLKGHIK